MATAGRSKSAKKNNEGKTLVVVESPSKAKTIGKFLGSNYKVVASVGHVRDLPKSKLGIDIENGFKPEYINIRGKGDVIRELKKEAKGVKNILLATDPDREGEAISWHIAYLLGVADDAEARIVFNEITKNAIKNSIKTPRRIDMNLVDAQQARRVLDRIVGYKISPLLWRKIRTGLSAGRVQSAALKIIVDREREIQAFVPEEFWRISVLLAKQFDDNAFIAKLAEKDGEKFIPSNKTESEEVLAAIKNGTYSVKTVVEKERRRKPYAPYTTSTLQQDASIKLGFQTRRVMSVAQQLYEGVTVQGYGTVGLITYIRKDSVRISGEAAAAAKAFIIENYGEKYSSDNYFSNKKKDIQDAHEAIRPSYVHLKPDDVKDSLTPEQYKLYSLIWSRFMASRMSEAVFDSVTAGIENGAYLFRATGSKLKFDGFLKVYQTALEEDEGNMLPALSEGEVLDEKEVNAEQSFTQPPPRFTEASLVKELEEKNIGRPSTFVPIIMTLTERRGYASRDKKTLIPTELGFVVTELMEKYFKEIVDAGFTAGMEDKLDDIEAEGRNWQGIVSEFYGVLKAELDIADEEIEKIIIEDEPTDEICELCGKPMVIKQGRYGKFIACSGYPDCKNTKPIVVKVEGVSCPLCGKDILVRKSRKGKTFYGCSGFPDCKQVYWYRPVKARCPKCGAFLLDKKSKTTKHVCSNTDCDYKD